MILTVYKQPGSGECVQDVSCPNHSQKLLSLKLEDCAQDQSLIHSLK